MISSYTTKIFLFIILNSYWILTGSLRNAKQRQCLLFLLFLAQDYVQCSLALQNIGHHMRVLVKLSVYLTHSILSLVYSTNGFVHYFQSIFGLFHSFLVQFEQLVRVHLQLEIIFLGNIVKNAMPLFIYLVLNLILKPNILLFLVMRVESVPHICQMNGELLVHKILLISIFYHRNLKKLHEIT